jgi:hypothetical protein
MATGSHRAMRRMQFGVDGHTWHGSVKGSEAGEG